MRDAERTGGGRAIIGGAGAGMSMYWKSTLCSTGIFQCKMSVPALSLAAPLDAVTFVELASDSKIDSKF